MGGWVDKWRMHDVANTAARRGLGGAWSARRWRAAWASPGVAWRCGGVGVARVRRAASLPEPVARPRALCEHISHLRSDDDTDSLILIH